MSQLCSLINQEVWAKLPDAIFQVLHPNLHHDMMGNQSSVIASRLTWRLFGAVADIYSWSIDECLHLMAGAPLEGKRFPVPMVEATHQLAVKHDLVPVAKGWLLQERSVTVDELRDLARCTAWVSSGVSSIQQLEIFNTDSLWREAAASTALGIALEHDLSCVTLPVGSLMSFAGISLDQFKTLLAKEDPKLTTLDERYFFFELPHALRYRIERLTSQQLLLFVSAALNWSVSCGGANSLRVKEMEKELALLEAL